MRKSDRYWIEIKDAKGSVVLSAAAVWDGDDRRLAIATILRLDGVLEPPSFPSQSSGQNVEGNSDIERIVAPLSVITPAKKTPRH